MKKIFILTVLAIIMARLPAHAQLAVADAAAGGLLLKTNIEQYAHYAMQVLQWSKEVEHMVKQAQNMAEMTERAIQNLQSARNIHSWDDFMDWYNRQLYLERTTIDAFKNANINIGKKNYKFSDAEGILSGMKDTYVDYWDKEFTEEQRREMWIELGLTPANYAFVQPLRAKANDLYRQNMFIQHVQTAEYIKDMEKNNEWNDKMADDKDKDANDKMGTNELLEGILETDIRNNIQLNNLNMYVARKMELDAIESNLAMTPKFSPALSKWSKDSFKPLDKTPEKK